MVRDIKVYKQSKIGLIPKNWDVKKVSEVTKVYDGTHSTPKYVEIGVPFYSVEHISKNDFSKTKFITEEVFQKENKRVILEKGDILMTRIGDVGTAKLIDWDVRASFYVSLALFKKSDDFDSKYFELYINSNVFQKEINQRMIHVAFPKKINLGEIGKCYVSLPPLKEQQKIAQILSQWDEAIETTQTLIDQLQLRKKGLMQELLSGKKRLPGFSDEWEEFQFGDLLKDVRRPVKWNDDELYNLISVRRRSGGLFFRESLYGNQILTKNLKTAKTGDFLISKMQIVHGASGLVTAEFDGAKISGSYLSLRVKDEHKTDINFINWLSKTSFFYYQTFISSYGVHIEKMTFNFKLFLRSKISIPSIEEQKKIVEILETAKSEINNQEEKLKQLKISKKGLMQQLLTGKKRVKL